jgi:hypothetical protein
MIEITIFGPFTGNPNKPYSYQVGAHWKGLIGYRVIEGKGNYNHFFGGQSWKLPTCQNCKEKLHQIFTFDLEDPRLSELKVNELENIPLITCLNCSYYWEPQTFKLNLVKKEVKVINQEDIHYWETDEEDKIPSPLPKITMKLVELFNNDIPLDEEHYENAHSYFGKEYVCRLLGAPLLASGPIDRECPCCSQEMKYVATVTGENYGNDSRVISTVEFAFGESFIYFLFCKKCLIIKTEMQSS